VALFVLPILVCQQHRLTFAPVFTVRRDEAQYNWAKSFKAICQGLTAYVKQHHAASIAWGGKVTWGGKMRVTLWLSRTCLAYSRQHLSPIKQVRSMTFWSNAIAQTAPGDEDAERYIYNTKLGMPIATQ
jgi:hypothetical protein